VARYEYDASGRLSAEWDPRISPALKEHYAYGSGGELSQVAPPGQEPWNLTYGAVEEEAGVGRLTAVRRASLVSGEAQTTVAYNVPVSGVGAPYELGGTSVSQWGQGDLPVEATAIFPPTEIPTTPPSSYGSATVYYMDSDGYAVNTATPKGGGTSSASISTAEPDEYGNIVRELTPLNRLAVLAKPEAEREKTWKALEAKRHYSEQGTQMVEEWGPMHPVRIAETGETVEARLHTVVEYDQGWPGTGIKPHLPTRETTAASNPALWGVDKEQRATETKYNWTLRKPTETVLDAGSGHLNVKSVIAYDESTGLPIEIRQPKSASESTSPGTTRKIYYAPGGAAPCASSAYAGLPCEILPASQTSGAGRFELPVKRFAKYDSLAEPTEVLESPGGGSSGLRKTLLTYDGAGRQVLRKIEGGGTAAPATETSYSPTTGLPTRQQIACEAGCKSGATYTSVFGGTGTGNGQFSHPSDVVVAPNGSLWVVDEGNNRVEQFSPTGTFIRAVGSTGSGNGQLKAPKAIAFTPNGNFWIVDSGNNRLEEFSSAGSFLTTFGSAGTAAGQFNSPEGIAIDLTGDLWVSDTGNSRLEEFSEIGKFLQQKTINFGGFAGKPSAIGVDENGDLWVAERTLNFVLEYSEEGAEIGGLGTGAGTGNGQFKQPDGVTVDKEGHIWVGDQGNNRVQEFNQRGEYLAQFGTLGTGAGQFTLSIPMGIAADSSGNLWVTDTNNNRIEKWTIARGSQAEATTTTYNRIGQVVAYRDADGNESKATYDIDGRPTTLNDGKGTQTAVYDPTSGLLTELKDSQAGTFTATYDADGNLKTRALPNGLTAATAYNSVDQPTGLVYTKESSCGEACTWDSEVVERSIYGQILTDNGTWANDSYSFDRAGRLTESRETPTGAGCTTRAYTFDADSNRLTKSTRAPGVGGVCVTSGGTEQKYSYDKADRLEGPTYDEWGRIRILPAEFAGGSALTTTYYGNEMVATQTQGAITNSFELDSTGRIRARLQGGGGLEGTEVFHYTGSSDSPAWTQRGSSWSRNVLGIGGDLAAVVEGGVVTVDLTNLHGDVVAAAEVSPTAEKLNAVYRHDEFGEPQAGSAGRFGWLGGKARRTEMPSGVVQMGARSYVPSLGRFLTPDPIYGGAANAYDYAFQDPVDKFDLAGTKVGRGKRPAKGWFAVGRKVKTRVTNEGPRTVATVTVDSYGQAGSRARNAQLHIQITGGVLKAQTPGTVVSKGFSPTPSHSSSCGGSEGYCDVDLSQSVEFEGPCDGLVTGYVSIKAWMSWTTAGGVQKTSSPIEVSYPVAGGVLCEPEGE
jgi:RHS repeat-associated protein